MGVYAYTKTRKNKKNKDKKIEQTYYFYSGKYTDQETEKRLSYKKRGFETKSSAEFAEHEFLKMVSTTNITKKIKFKELADDYILYTSTRRKGSTVQTTQQHLDSHLLPFFGNKYIDKITSNDVMRFQQLKQHDKKNYTSSYINHLCNTLKKILNFGVKHYGLKENTAAKVDKLNENKDIDVDNEVLYWDIADFNKFINEADDIEYKTLFTMLYFTGIRRGECLSLNWNDFDELNNRIKITKTLTKKLSKEQKSNGMKYDITLPKTKKSVRTITIPKFLTEMLTDLKNIDMCVEGWNEQSFIFGISKPIAYTTLDRKLKTWSKASGVPILSPHGLRHSHVSYLINNGINILAVANRAGDTVEMILKVYAHLFQNTDNEIVSLLNNCSKSMPIVCQNAISKK
ncbi:MAG: tyrosine-type recombinase/integrase [Myroides sp.]